MSARVRPVASGLLSLVAIVASALPTVDATPCDRAHGCRTAPAPPTVERRHDPVITAAGDIAAAEPSSATRATARLVDLIDPKVALTLGDNQYPEAAYQDFLTGYDPTWGRFRARTRPALGNHEYDGSATAAGYFRYFGDRAPNNFYSFDVGAWHLISLDSNCGHVGCEAGTRQYSWLRRDLARSSADCTLAYWHHPRWSSGGSGSNPQMTPFVRLLWRAHAEVLLSGHEHNYERFAPQSPEGGRRPRGVAQFVVGTGGKSLGSIDHAEDNSLVREDESYGVLRMVLHPHSYEFAFRSVLGSNFRDAGARRCR
jgi:hypothetical protein